MADKKFVPIPYSQLSPQAKANAEANAKASGMASGEEYIKSRGGINRAGYYGDSYVEGKTLTDEEYFAAIDAATKGGATGAQIGEAINLATSKKMGTSGNTPSGASNLSSGLDPAVSALLEKLSTQNANFTNIIKELTAQREQDKIDAAAEAERNKRAQAENAITVLSNRFKQYNLGSLVPKIKELAIGGANEDTITLQLAETPEYKQRFRANEERVKKNLAVLTPGDYIRMEDNYRQVLRAYGLRQFDTDDYVTQFIENDISRDELASRVQLAVQRVQNADPATLNTLTRYYGIGTTDLVAYALDPNTQFQKIERQVAAAEIGAAAGLQGIRPGVTVAEQLAAQGITQAEAQRGYATIADILPQAGKLSAIYTDVLDQYGQAEAEQEVFNSLASAQRKRRALSEREIAAFSGQSGLGRGALGTVTGGTF